MSTEDLNGKLNEATMKAAEWRAKVGRIQNAIAAAQAVVNSSEQRRAKFALDAATGDANAAAAMKKIHAEDDAAKKQLADLNMALVPAQQQRAAFEQAEGNARREVNRQLAHGTMRKRIAVAARIDKALAEFDAAMKEFDALGDELHGHHLDTLSSRGYSLSTAVSQFEGLTGMSRLMAALPPIFRKLFPLAILPEARAPLAQSEAAFWNIEMPSKTEKAA